MYVFLQIFIKINESLNGACYLFVRIVYLRNYKTYFIEILYEVSKPIGV
jgi:hypothetical protein